VAELEDETTGIPQIARQALAAIVVQVKNLTTSIRELDKRIVAWCRANDAARRLATIPGVGPITASALAATVTDPTLFRSGRHLAAWLGLVPRQRSTCGKANLGRITKMGDQYAPDQGSSLRLGSTRCSSAAQRAWSRWRWPTRRADRLGDPPPLPRANDGGSRMTNKDRQRLPPQAARSLGRYRGAFARGLLRLGSTNQPM
jgi:transposase